MSKGLLTFVLLFCIIISKAQNVIIVQHGTTTTIETRLDTAISHAQSGDIVYLPGGVISAGPITINKLLTIIGAGYHPDSSLATGFTWLTSPIVFNTGSSGSMLTGIYSTEKVTINSSNITLSRNEIYGVIFSTQALSNILIEETICRHDITGGHLSLSNILLRKNIIYGDVSDLATGGVTFNNNIFIGSPSMNTSDCLFQNNIFLSTLSGTAYWGTTNQYANNLFVASNSVLAGGSHTFLSINLYNEPLANIFTHYDLGSPWGVSQNFHLKAGCNGINLGMDGKDAGIYGSQLPFKDGGMTFNPHIQSINIPGTTSSNGKLNINITVRGQSN